MKDKGCFFFPGPGQTPVEGMPEPPLDPRCKRRAVPIHAYEAAIKIGLNPASEAARLARTWATLASDRICTRAPSMYSAYLGTRTGAGWLGRRPRQARRPTPPPRSYNHG